MNKVELTLNKNVVVLQTNSDNNESAVRIYEILSSLIEFVCALDEFETEITFDGDGVQTMKVILVDTSEE